MFDFKKTTNNLDILSTPSLNSIPVVINENNNKFIIATNAVQTDSCSFTQSCKTCSNKDSINTISRTDVILHNIQTDYLSQLFLFSFGIMGIYTLHLLLKNKIKK